MAALRAATSRLHRRRRLARWRAARLAAQPQPRRLAHGTGGPAGVGEDRITLVCWQAMDGDNDRAGEDAQYAHHAASADAALLAQAAGGMVRMRVEAHELGATQAQVNTHIESAWTVDGEIAAYASQCGCRCARQRRP
ncbi:hypothetical protein ACU4GD_30155 [Cupriavidus basilensis]